MAKAIIIGTAWITRKAKAAERGDAEALEQLRTQYVKEVKRANQNARNLDRHGMDTGALKQYRKNLDGNFISQSKNLDIDTMVSNMKRAEKFLKAKTSTVTGELERQHNQYLALTRPKRDKRGRITAQSFVKPPPEGMSKLQQERALNRFLSNKHFEELKKNFGSNVIAQAADAINQGVPVGRLSRLYNEYVRAGERADLDMVWNAFTSGEKHI
jgi:hypothetical protein